MADPDPAAVAGPPPAQSSRNLTLRVLSSVVLAPLALAIAYAGGLVFALFWTIAASVVLWEWARLVNNADLGAGAAAGWLAMGILYAGVLLAGPVALRSDPTLGFTAIVFVFAVVWVTDIGAYFAGRAIGGPKLWPAVSPKKTWSGAVGGAIGGVAGGLLIARLGGLAITPMLVIVAAALSVVAQAGDLLESAIKRRFGVKDSSQLIPGHGGLMDRLDGFLTAAAAAVMVGLVRGGLEGPARGLLVW